ASDRAPSTTAREATITTGAVSARASGTAAARDGWILRRELPVVEVEEGAAATREHQKEIVDAGHQADVARDLFPGLPAARWLDAASPEQLAILGAEAQLEASTSARRRDAGGERERPGAEVHRLDLDVVAILRVRDVASSCLAVLHLDAA